MEERAESSEAAVIYAREECARAATESARAGEALAEEHAAAQDAAAHALASIAGELRCATTRERSAAADVEIQADIADALRAELAAAEARAEGAGAEATAHAARALAAEAAHVETCANARRAALAQRVASSALAAATASRRIQHATARAERVASERVTAAHRGGLRILRAAEAEHATAEHARTAAALEEQSAQLAARLCAAARRSPARAGVARTVAAEDDGAPAALETTLRALEERAAQPAALGDFLATHDEFLAMERDADAAAVEAAAAREELAVAAEARAALRAQVGRAATRHTATLLSGQRAALHRYQRGEADAHGELCAHKAAHEAAQRERACAEHDLRDALASAATAHTTALADAVAVAEARAAAELERERGELRERASEFAMSALEQLQSSQRHAADLTASIAEQRATALELASVECVDPAAPIWFLRHRSSHFRNSAGLFSLPPPARAALLCRYDELFKELGDEQEQCRALEAQVKEIAGLEYDKAYAITLLAQARERALALEERAAASERAASAATAARIGATEEADAALAQLRANLQLSRAGRGASQHAIDAIGVENEQASHANSSSASHAAGAAGPAAAASPEREVYALQAAEQTLATVHARAASLAAQIDEKDAAIERLEQDKAFAVRLLAEERRRNAIAEHSSGSGSLALGATFGSAGATESAK